VVVPNPGWTGPSTWQGKYWVQSDTDFGTNTLRVRGATALDGWVVPDDTSFTIALAEGKPSANNGVAVGTGVGLYAGVGSGEANFTGQRRCAASGNTTWPKRVGS